MCVLISLLEEASILIDVFIIGKVLTITNSILAAMSYGIKKINVLLSLVEGNILYFRQRIREKTIIGAG